VNVLAIGAHPDDIELYCAGTLARYAAAGHKVAMAVVCSGATGVHSLPLDEAARLRELESLRSASLIGAEAHHLRYLDHQIPSDEAPLLRITDLIRRAEASVVITHDPNDCFIDHKRTTQLVEEAIDLAVQPNVQTESPPASVHPVLFYMDTVTGLAFQPSDFVDVTPVFDVKRRMLECHQSQIQPILDDSDEPIIMELMEISARFRGIQCAVRYAEAFRQQLKYDRSMTWRLLP
jgi:LmbE family N-acetylglucosaminyl deacetylase